MSGIRRQLILAVAAVGLLLSSATPAIAQEATLVALVNRSRPESDVSRNELIQIFRGEIRYWDNRQLIQPVLPPRSDPAGESFIRNVLKTTPDEFERSWQGKRYRGETAIVAHPVSSLQYLIRAVELHAGYVAIVDYGWLRSLDPRLLTAVKMLSVNGVMPEEPGYPLTVAVEMPQQWIRFAESLTDQQILLVERPGLLGKR